ncbi:peptide ABC transporter ATP-binding protein, partial [Streptococcus pyogenes]
NAGEKSFGELVSDKVVSYGDEWANVDFSDAQNGLYNVEKAKAEFEKAKATLAADGVEFPIHLDMPVVQESEVGVQQASSMKQSIEAALGSDNVVIDLQMLDQDTFTNIAFYTEA